MRLHTCFRAPTRWSCSRPTRTRVGTRTRSSVAGLAVDTGFIVHNRRNYPLLTRLFRELGVETRPTKMSFSMSCGCGASWSSRRPWRAGRLLVEIQRFLRTAGTPMFAGKTFDEFLPTRGTRTRFRWHYLVPMTSALWSTAPGDALRFPAELGITFFRNHGMLGLRRERWRTVGRRESGRTSARSSTRIGAPVRLGRPVTAVARSDHDVTLTLADGERVTSRRRSSLRPTPRRAGAAHEADVPGRGGCLSVFAMTANETVLHTDARLLPSRRRASASAWNYQSPGCGALRAATERHVLDEPAPEARERRRVLRHPQPDGRDRSALVMASVIGYDHPRMTLRERLPRSAASRS